MPLPAIVALLAKGAAAAARIVPAIARGVGAAATTVGQGAADAGKAFVGSWMAAPQIVRGMFPGQGMANAARAAASGPGPGAMAARAAASPVTQTTVNINAPQAVQQAAQQATRTRWRGTPPASSAPAAAARAAPQSPAQPPSPASTGAWGPKLNPATAPPGLLSIASRPTSGPVVNSGGGRSWALPNVTGQQAVAQAATNAAQQGNFQTSARNAQGMQSRWMQRGAQLYQASAHESKRDQQRDLIEFNKNLAAGAEAFKRFDPKALAFWGKAAGIGLKQTAMALAGPIGLAVALAFLPKKLRDLGDALLERSRPLAELHGGHAATFARLDVNRMGRNVQFASATSGSTNALAQSVNRLETRLLPYAVAGTNALNRLLAISIGNWERAIKIMERWSPGLQLIIDWFAKEPHGESQSLTQLALDLRDGKPFKDRIKPPLEDGERRGRR